MSKKWRTPIKILNARALRPVSLWRLRHALGVLAIALVCFVLVIGSLLYKEAVPSAPFPVGVDPENKIILEDPQVEDFAVVQLAFEKDLGGDAGWFKKALQTLTRIEWYQHLASPGSRLLIIEPGERKEEVADNFGDILDWEKEDGDAFLEQSLKSAPGLEEGQFFPDSYLVSYDASPEVVAKLVDQRFEEEVLSRYTRDVSEKVPLKDALTIASILEREAYDFTDMREISGVIWNRLFISMNLQIDSTLQYAKGSLPTGAWWPVPIPRDKYIDSPFNTYQNKGLPPGPIANPSLNAILAALNPKATDCLFYFHDSRSRFHCSPTYEEHVSLLKQYYGRGR